MTGLLLGFAIKQHHQLKRPSSCPFSLQKKNAGARDHQNACLLVIFNRLSTSLKLICKALFLAPMLTMGKVLGKIKAVEPKARCITGAGSLMINLSCIGRKNHSAKLYGHNTASYLNLVFLFDDLVLI